MKKLLLATLLVLLAAPLQAQVRWGARAGVSDGNPMIGVDFVHPIGGGFVINPNLEFTTDLFTANADVHYDFRLNPDVDFWVGAGLAFVNPADQDYDGGFNVLAGAAMRRNRWYPYGQLKITSAGDVDDFFTAAVGVRF